MTRGEKVLVMLGLAAVGVYIYENYFSGSGWASSGCPITDAETTAQAAESQVQAAVSGWQAAGSGPTWVPILNQYESQYGFPQNMLAALAFQESSFIENIIRGKQASSAGALGMMQLMPQYYSTLVGPSGAAVPYQDSDVEAQIDAACQTFQTNYNSLGSWPLAIAAYNAGLGAVNNAGPGIPQNGQTPAYVAGILANAPAANDGTVSV
jgi:soluble lytic murein transglycosylase-like protein